MATSVGAFEAKTHLSSLLERVERGEEVLITRHGRPVARLLPPSPGGREADDAVEQLRRFRRDHRMGLTEWNVLVSDGTE